MVSNEGSGKPTTRRYSPEEKAAAVRMVRTLRAGLGTEHGTIHRVASQLGYGVESVRTYGSPVLASENLDEPPAKGLEYRGLQVRGQLLPVDLLHRGQIARVHVHVLGALEHG